MMVSTAVATAAAAGQQRLEKVNQQTEGNAATTRPGQARLKVKCQCSQTRRMMIIGLIR